MAKKAQNETVTESNETLKAKLETADLKAKWEQAAKEAQEAWQQVIDTTQRFMEIENLIRTVESKEERRNLIRERGDLQVELEALPFEAGPANREKILACFRYFKAEEQWLQKWVKALNEAEQRYYNPETRQYEAPESFYAEWQEQEEAFKTWKRLGSENGIFTVLGPYVDWHNETLWEEYASRSQESTIRGAIKVRDSILNGTWGKPIERGPILYRTSY